MKKLTSNVNHTIEFLRSEDKIVLEKVKFDNQLIYDTFWLINFGFTVGFN